MAVAPQFVSSESKACAQIPQVAAACVPGPDPHGHTPPAPVRLLPAWREIRHIVSALAVESPVMEQLWNLNLIHFLDFYLMFFFVVSTIRYFGLYWAICSIAWSVPGRWPKLLELIREHSTIFIHWGTMLPFVLALVLSLVQVLASRVVWSYANLSAGDLAAHWLFLLLIVPVTLAMIAVDVFSM